MKLATFNINSINKRYEIVQNWIISENIDVICLQELKSQKTFSFDSYECAITNQKQFNGVATCSIYPIQITNILEPARAIYTKIENNHIINIYAPLGDLYGEKFEYKLNFYNNLIKFISKFDLTKEKLILLGDFNIIHKNIDVFNPIEWEGHVTFLPEERDIMNKLLSLGLYDSFRELYPNKQDFSFFEYRDKGFNKGLRLDYILVSRPILDKINDVYIDLAPRHLPTPSDHTPVVLDFNDR
jgi:exodeoxyribonuclease-3